MKRKPLQPITMAQVLAALAAMDDDVFEQLRQEATGVDAFDNDKERVEPLALRLNLDVSTVQLILSFLSFLYDEIHDEAVDASQTEEAVIQIIDSVKKIEQTRGYLKNVDESLLAKRLTLILEKNANIVAFIKTKRLRSGFLPVAAEFKSFVDLRPLFTDDRQDISRVIPIIQFMISAESPQPNERSYVFQMDSRRLRALKDAVDAAIQKLDVISANNPLSLLIK